MDIGLAAYKTALGETTRGSSRGAPPQFITSSATSILGLKDKLHFLKGDKTYPIPEEIAEAIHQTLNYNLAA